ncbi:MAG: hypothetical protein NZ481_08005 [Candidatus Kapabacteria bacterium]|nr:hypothetical protein [Candidatus Kapabacteria bacterium]
MRWMTVSLLVAVGGASVLYGQRLEQQVVSSGAVQARGAGIVLRGTIGQPIVGLTGNASVTIGQGFWYRSKGTLSAQEAAPFAVRVQPQPAVTEAVVELECTSAAEAAVFTAAGKQLAVVGFVVEEGRQRARIDCTELASGLYLVRVRCGAEEHVLPLVVAK